VAEGPVGPLSPGLHVRQKKKSDRIGPSANEYGYYNMSPFKWTDGSGSLVFFFLFYKFFIHI